MDGQTGRQTDRQTATEMDGQRWTDRTTDRQTEWRGSRPSSIVVLYITTKLLKKLKPSSVCTIFRFEV